MDYERTTAAAGQLASQLDGYRNAVPPLERTDLGSLRARLSECVKRAEDLGIGAHNLADSIIGTRPSDICESAPPRPVEPSFSHMIDDLAAAIGRIESGLNRL